MGPTWAPRDPWAPMSPQCVRHGPPWAPKLLGPSWGSQCAQTISFLQQDLRLTTTKLNEDIQETLKRVLKEEFAQYSQSIDDARSLAIQSIEKTQTAMEQQRLQLTSELKEYVDKERQVIVARMDEHLTETIHSYIVEVLGDEVDLAAQSSYILRRLEEDKETIREDIVNVIQP